MNEDNPLSRILVVDDEPVVRNGISRLLAARDTDAVTASDGEEALDFLRHQSFDLVLLDIKMPGPDGVQVLKQIRSKYPQTPVVMITGYPTIDTAVECIKLGALDYLVKPFQAGDLDAVLKKIVRQDGMSVGEGGERGLALDSKATFIIGKSRVMTGIFQKIRKVAPTESTVLITGESGTGKELVAKAIHAYSRRREKEFVAVDCSSLVETLLESELFGHVKGSFTGAHQTKHGLFELANEGTFFFDEIGNLSLNIQAKLLRVIQEREFMKVGDQKKIKVDVRIIAASNKDLQESIRSGAFREDLYYRLSVVPIHLPALRNRKEDIPLLVDHFLKQFSRRIKRPTPVVSEEALETLMDYSWPGNIRELEHTIERVLILEDTDIIRSRDLPAFISQRQGDFQMFYEEPLSLADLEKRYIRFILGKTKGKRTAAADILGINRKTLSMKIKKYDL
jgi:DNA-binding NtrC family response regulator